MSKELPWFKFTADKWILGKISIESFETQGFFVSLCAYYWGRCCQATYAEVIKKWQPYSSAMVMPLTETLQCLEQNNIIKIDDGFICIEFLDDQLKERTQEHKKKVSAGKSGASARWHSHKPANAIALAKHSNKDVDVDVDKDVDKDIKTWRSDIETYKNELESAKGCLLNDPVWIKTTQEDFPNADIKKSLERQLREYWSLEGTWKSVKRKRKGNTVRMREWLSSNFPKNIVYMSRESKEQTTTEQPTMYREFKKEW